MPSMDGEKSVDHGSGDGGRRFDTLADLGRAMLPGQAIGVALPNSSSRAGVVGFGLGAVHPPPQPDVCVGPGVSGAAQSPNPSSSSAQGDCPEMAGILGEPEAEKKARGGGSRSDLVDFVGDGGCLYFSVSAAVHGEPHGSSIASGDNFHVAQCEPLRVTCSETCRFPARSTPIVCARMARGL